MIIKFKKFLIQLKSNFFMTQIYLLYLFFLFIQSSEISNKNFMHLSSQILNKNI